MDEFCYFFFPLFNYGGFLLQKKNKNKIVM